MSLTEGKNILVYVETAGDTPVGPALEILAKAKNWQEQKVKKLSQLFLAKEPDAAARTAIEAGADEAVIVKTEEKRPEVRAAMHGKTGGEIYTGVGAGSSDPGGQRCYSAGCTEIRCRMCR